MERDHLGDIGTDGRKILKWITEEKVVKVWIGYNWLRIGSNGRHLWTW
jgi:hypothetical protein